MTTPIHTETLTCLICHESIQGSNAYHLVFTSPNHSMPVYGGLTMHVKCMPKTASMWSDPDTIGQLKAFAIVNELITGGNIYGNS